MTRIMWLGIAGLCAAVLSLAGAFLYLDPQIPRAETYRQVRLETPLRVYSADEKLIAEFGERRVIPLKLDEAPPLFVSALLDTEDKRFYDHSGIDYISLLNDTVELALNREIRSGASTITMQLARNISFSLEQTFIRKFKEMLLALQIEQELSKDEILELYMNVVPFGKRAYGAQAADATWCSGACSIRAR
jgi:penicillin-binding protein 1A